VARAQHLLLCPGEATDVQGQGVLQLQAVRWESGRGRGGLKTPSRLRVTVVPG